MILKKICADIGTTPKISSIIHTDYYFLGVFGGINASNYLYTYYGKSKVVRLVFISNGVSNLQYVKTTMREFFLNEGFTEKQTAGILENSMKEFSFNPLVRTSGGQYWGLL